MFAVPGRETFWGDEFVGTVMPGKLKARMARGRMGAKRCLNMDGE